MTKPSPLCFEPIYKEKVWGGRMFESFGRILPGHAEAKIGESWELADLGQTSVSGGGGGEARSRITTGSFAGQTLHDALRTHGQAILGRLPLNAFAEFPLLVKLLDACENLSVQVHPSHAYAAEHADAFLKSEAWYVLHAEPNAVIYKGLQPGVTAKDMREALKRNTVEAVEPLLIQVPVKQGDCHYLPSGTCHALGAGLVVAEVQTPSDTTFRVFDWGRVDRELHIEQALACMDFGPCDASRYEPGTVIPGQGVVRRSLVRCEYFHWDDITFEQGYRQSVTLDQPIVWMILSGSGKLGEHRLQAGQTWLLPASLEDEIHEVDSPMQLLETRFPQAQSTQLA